MEVEESVIMQDFFSLHDLNEEYSNLFELTKYLCSEIEFHHFEIDKILT